MEEESEALDMTEGATADRREDMEEQEAAEELPRNDLIWIFHV